MAPPGWRPDPLQSSRCLLPVRFPHASLRSCPGFTPDLQPTPWGISEPTLPVLNTGGAKVATSKDQNLPTKGQAERRAPGAHCCPPTSAPQSLAGKCP